MRGRQLLSEQGAILIQTALASVLLLGMCAFVVDLGMVYVSRNQAQNAADAGALSGAVSLAFDGSSTPSATAGHSAWATAHLNNVWGEPPAIVITTPYSGAPCPDYATSCVRVDIYRDGTHGSSTLPRFFSSIFNGAVSRTRASAVAWAGAGNASECLKPWAVADKWLERNPTAVPWTPTSTFDPTGGTPDEYAPPTATDPGTGFTLAADLGVEIKLKVGSPHEAINPGWFQALDLTGGGGSAYRANISGCAGVTYKIGDTIAKENGNMVGPTGQGTKDLIDLDPDADWDPVAKRIVNSCVDPPYSCSTPGLTQSPRVVAIPIFDLAEYMSTGGPGNGDVRLVNILGFFVDRIQNPQNTVIGNLVTIPSLKVAGGGSITPDAAFAKVIQLVK